MKTTGTNWIVKLLVIIGGLWLLMQISFLPTLIFFGVAGLLALVLLFLLGAAAIPGIILYGLGRALGIFKPDPKPSRPQERPDADAWETEHSAPSEDLSICISSRLHLLVDAHRAKLSEPVVSRLETTINLVEDLEAVLDAISPASEQHHTLVQTADSYIPEMLSGYLKLPPDFARTHRLQNGLTPREVLLEQLDVLNAELTALRNAAYEEKTEDLIAHGEFLKSKYQKPKPFLDIR